MNKLIGLYSPAAQSGKSTVAKFLAQQHGYTIVPFAETLKEMLIPMLSALGYSNDDAYRLVQVDKQIVVPGAEVSVRHMLRTLGTEWGRQCIHPDIWLRCWQQRIKPYNLVVADDVRFPNEAELVRSLGGEVWFVERPDAVRTHEHASEGSLDTYHGFTKHLVNDGALSDFVDKLRGIAQP